MGEYGRCESCGQRWGCSCREVTRLHAIIAEQAATIARLEGERDEAHGYLSRLLTHRAPQCEPLEDLLGVCTQIDNLLEGLVPVDRALAERPTCATCRHFAEETEVFFPWCMLRRVRSNGQEWSHMTQPYQSCADHEPAPLPSCSICRRDDCGGDCAGREG